MKDPDKPKARGPIAFDSQKTPTESPPSPSGEPFATSEPSARVEVDLDVRFCGFRGIGEQGRRLAAHQVVSTWPSNTRFDT